VTQSEARTAVIGAMPEEVATLLPLLQNRDSFQVGPFELHDGFLDGHPVTLAVCGVGKANAAALTQAMLMHGCERVVFTGVAGGLDPALSVGDIVVSSDAVQHDVDVTALGYELGVVPGEEGVAWTADQQLAAIALEVAKEVVPDANVLMGRVASGDAFIADDARVAELRTRFSAACAEMEGAAVAQVCARWGVPWVVIRSLSDAANGEASMDFRAFTQLAAGRAEKVVRGVLARLSSERQH